MGFCKGMKYQFQMYHGGRFVSQFAQEDEVSDPNLHFRCKNIRVPYIPGLIVPVDGSWCNCVEEDPPTLIAETLCYGGVMSEHKPVFAKIRQALKRYVGELRDTEVIDIQKALKCVTLDIDELNTNQILDMFCQYLALGWNEQIYMECAEYNTEELRNRIHIMLYGYEVASFIWDVKKLRPQTCITAGYEGDDKIHIYLDGKDAVQSYNHMIENTESGKSVRGLLKAAEGSIEKEYDYVDMFMDWFTRLDSYNKNLINDEDKRVFSYAYLNDTISLRKEFDRQSLYRIMGRIYAKRPPTKYFSMKAFEELMYYQSNEAAWEKLKQLDETLYCAVCNGEIVDKETYNPAHLNEISIQLGPVKNPIGRPEPSWDCVIFFSWVKELSAANMDIANECHKQAIIAAKNEDYDWFEKSDAPLPMSIMRTYYDKIIHSASPEWAYNFYDKLYTSQNSHAWYELMNTDYTLFKAAVNYQDLTNGEYTSAILDNISNRIFATTE